MTPDEITELRWIHELVSSTAEKTPEAPLLVAPHRTYSYREIDTRSNQVARWLCATGTEVGDRIAILATNTAEYVTAYYAISKAGAIAVPVNTAVDGASLAFVLENSQARAILTEPRFGEIVKQGCGQLRDGSAPDVVSMDPIPDRSAAEVPVRENPVGEEDRTSAPSSWSPAWTASDGPVHPSGVPSRAPVSIIYTSGSTGTPRGATLSHRNILVNTASIVSYLGLTAGDRMMVILPFYYVYGKSLLNTHAAVGGSLIIGTDLYFPNSVVKRMRSDGATGFAGVPSTFTVMLSRSKLAADPPPSLRYLTQAGGAMAPDLTRQVLEQLPAVDLFVMYGATEAGARLSYLDPRELPQRIGSIGKAIPNVKIRIEDEAGREVPVDQPGELVASGENIMLGYWNDPEETALVLDHGRLRTGDLARRDKDGFLYIVGRKKEMIKSGAHRVSPKEIEETLMDHPRVLEAAVIGVPDELLGEAIHAFVVLDAAAAVPESSELIAWAATQLPEYKVPRVIEFREALPKNESGKIQKMQLRDGLF